MSLPVAPHSLTMLFWLLVTGPRLTTIGLSRTHGAQPGAPLGTSCSSETTTTTVALPPWLATLSFKSELAPLISSTKSFVVILTINLLL